MSYEKLANEEPEDRFMANIPEWQLEQFKKDTRYQRVAAIHVDVSEQFQVHFKELDQLADASLKLFMSDGFTGAIVAQEKFTDEEAPAKSDLQIKSRVVAAGILLPAEGGGGEGAKAAGGAAALQDAQCDCSSRLRFRGHGGTSLILSLTGD